MPKCVAERLLRILAWIYRTAPKSNDIWNLDGTADSHKSHYTPARTMSIIAPEHSEKTTILDKLQCKRAYMQTWKRNNSEYTTILGKKKLERAYIWHRPGDSIWYTKRWIKVQPESTQCKIPQSRTIKQKIMLDKNMGHKNTQCTS